MKLSDALEAPMTEHTSDLLPCPFCGGTADMYPAGMDARRIECVRCDSAQVGGTKARAIAAWNRRAPDLLAENTRLREVNAGLMGALREARDNLHNPFEPDNQSRAFKRVDAALRAAEEGS